MSNEPLLLLRWFESHSSVNLKRKFEKKMSVLSQERPESAQSRTETVQDGRDSISATSGEPSSEPPSRPASCPSSRSPSRPASRSQPPTSPENSSQSKPPSSKMKKQKASKLTKSSKSSKGSKPSKPSKPAHMRKNIRYIYLFDIFHRTNYIIHSNV